MKPAIFYRIIAWSIVAMMLVLVLARYLDAKDPFVRKSTVKAPELAGGVAWLNTDKPVTLAELRGKVVLLDFWTFG